MHGTLTGFHSGRYIVDVAGQEDLVKIDQLNLRRVGALEPGDMAEIHGLAGDGELFALNGLKALVKDYAAEHGEFVVDVILPVEDAEEDEEDGRSKTPNEYRLAAVNL
jgi:hypothetical protein